VVLEGAAPLNSLWWTPVSKDRTARGRKEVDEEEKGDKETHTGFQSNDQKNLTERQAI